MGKNQLFCEQLSEEQQAAVTHGDGPLLIVAGAGSGKTRTLTHRLINIIERGVAPNTIVAITFTNKAANEIKQRLLGSLRESGISSENLPFLGTFHSYCASILRKEAKHLGRTSAFGIFDSDDSLRTIKKVLDAEGVATSSTQAKRALAVKLQRDFGKIKNELANADDFSIQTKELFVAYELSLKKQNAFDFDDLIEKTARLFQERPDILKKYQERAKYILIDEYQDTNTSQYMLVKLLSSKYRNITVVGDDQQSIYRFRGSDFRNFLNFERDWPDVKIIELGKNYRSTNTIVQAAASVIEKNMFQHKKKLWSDIEGGEAIKIIGSESAEEEAMRLTHAILSKKSEGEREIAVLYRTNAQSRAIEQTFNFNTVPYEIYGGFRFYDRKEIKDMVAALRYGVNPRDEISLERLDKAFRKAPYRELAEKLPKMTETLSPVELIGFIMKTTDYETYLQSKFKNSEERMDNIRELISFATTFETTHAFLERVSLLESHDQKQKTTSNHPVKLMTIHLAKGLEFDNVFVVGVNDGTLPHARSLRSQEDIEEERRLMYVAMTRARRSLTLSFYNVASRFLNEMPPELVEFSNSAHRLYTRYDEQFDDFEDDFYLD
jgi:DNA helicase-2/ATP-dependent DNA helicase PcrA